MILDALDVGMFWRIYGHASGPLKPFMVALTLLGSGWAVLPIAMLLLAPRSRNATKGVLVAVVTTAGVVALIKLLVARVRPCNSLDGVSSIFFAAPTDFSFPSGHAAGSFACASFVAVLLLERTQRSASVGEARTATMAWVAIVGLFALASGVAVSRVYLGVHYPSDVIGAALIGTTIGGAIARWFAMRRGRSDGPESIDESRRILLRGRRSRP